jgi:hypothetical protein
MCLDAPSDRRRLAKASICSSACPIDGRDISAVLTRMAGSPHDQLVLFDNEDVVGIRTQR